VNLDFQPLVDVLDGEVQHPVAEEILPLDGESRSRLDSDAAGLAMLPGGLSR